MSFLIRMMSLICKSAVLSIQIIVLMLLGVTNSAFICPKQRMSRLNDCYSIKGMSSRQFDHVLQIQQPRWRKAPPVLQGSLRDILNDGPVSATKSDLDSHIDTVEKRQKLTNQLQNISTQEIKRELEQTYKISTAALRGKDQLITALVMARLNGSLSVPPIDGGVDPNFRDQYQEPPRGASNGPGSVWINNANYKKDMELMGVGEIKRELQLYGVSTDGYADKRELLDVLIRERQLRNIPTPSKRPKIEVNVVPTAASQSNRNSHPESLSDDRGNESIRSPSKMAELTKVTVISKNQKEAKQSMADSAVNSPFPAGSQDFYPPSAPNPFFADEKFPLSDFAQQNENGSYDGAKLRELQIAFEFERVQGSLPTPAEIQSELASKFNIDVKYFMGLNEMAYALAVARVDDAIERQNRRRAGKDDDGCVVSDKEGGTPISKNRNANFDGVISSNFNGQSSRPECIDEVGGVLPSREELISMEFQRLQPLDEYELSWELEAQYGIPAKHFLGKRELAYALAVERVDTAQKEADAANGSESDTGSEAAEDSTQFAWMSDEEMMRMMEEEMMKEELPKQTINTNEANKFNQRPTNSVRSTASQQDQSQPSSQPTSLKDMIRNNSKKVSTRSQQSSSGNFQYQGESLRERERRKGKSPQPSMGTVIGGDREDKRSVSHKPPAEQYTQQKNNPTKAQSRPLSDVIKGSSKSSGQQTSRVRATTPPPRPKQRQRPPRSVSKASSPFDTSFGVGAWQTTSGTGNAATNAYQNNYRAQSNYYGAQNNYGMPPRSPFEVPPFPDPEIFNNRAGPTPPPPPPLYGPYSSQVYVDMGTSFEPGKFTPPRKHNVDGMPPPPRGRKNANSRSFNIRDTEGPRPFVGSQTVMDQFSNSPPLQVEPPPRDENNPPPQRPFEPAPFSSGSRSSVYDDRPPREPHGNQWKTAPQPPPRTQQRAASQSKQAGASPFDRVKDMFKNMANGGSDNTDKYQDHVKFKDDKVEVMNDDWSPFASNEPRQKPKSKAADVRFIDAELDAENSHKYQEFTNAWKGGPKSAQSYEAQSYEPEDIPDQTGVYQSQEYTSHSQTQPPDAMKRAYELLANPEIQALAAKAKSNPKVREAVQACMGDPASFGSYLEDPEIGPVLQELKEFIL